MSQGRSGLRLRLRLQGRRGPIKAQRKKQKQKQKQGKRKQGKRKQGPIQR